MRERLRPAPRPGSSRVPAPAQLALPLALLAGCPQPLPHSVSALDAEVAHVAEGAGLVVTNDASVTVCYVEARRPGARERPRDLLEPTDVVLAGEERSFALDPGVWGITLLDCNHRVLAEESALELEPPGQRIRLTDG
ncbi:MAG TPA: hypothetical protein RMH80_01990 [Polyangiaceae bacterium LLY-WYZ-15_(1-7)]|nr:hypothetical protein [Polyangiaceae bacterium LLY-WYZ-15_(1-7)]